jgi:riboflavin kinase/FMN adenylyltransferase
MLTRPYRIRGVVSQGAGRGTQLGFPTANLEAITTVLPAHGVYGGATYRVAPSSALDVGRCTLDVQSRGNAENVERPTSNIQRPAAPERWPAAINVGPNPTFGETATKVEVHLIGFASDLYGETIEVEFLDRLRDVRKFAGIEDLKTQLGRDIRAAQAAAG